MTPLIGAEWVPRYDHISKWGRSAYCNAFTIGQHKNMCEFQSCSSKKSNKCLHTKFVNVVLSTPRNSTLKFMDYHGSRAHKLDMVVFMKLHHSMILNLMTCAWIPYARLRSSKQCSSVNCNSQQPSTVRFEKHFQQNHRCGITILWHHMTLWEGTSVWHLILKHALEMTAFPMKSYHLNPLFRFRLLQISS